MDIVSIIQLIVTSGLLIALVQMAFKLGRKDQKVDEHDLKLKDHDNEIRELKECNNEVKSRLASIETNILWIKEKLMKE